VRASTAADRGGSSGLVDDGGLSKYGRRSVDQGDCPPSSMPFDYNDPSFLSAAQRVGRHLHRCWINQALGDVILQVYERPSSRWVRSIVMGMSVCLSVCLSACFLNSLEIWFSVLRNLLRESVEHSPHHVVLQASLPQFTFFYTFFQISKKTRFNRIFKMTGYPIVVRRSLVFCRHHIFLIKRTHQIHDFAE